MEFPYLQVLCNVRTVQEKLDHLVYLINNTLQRDTWDEKAHDIWKVSQMRYCIKFCNVVHNNNL